MICLTEKYIHAIGGPYKGSAKFFHFGKLGDVLFGFISFKFWNFALHFSLLYCFVVLLNINTFLEMK